MPATIAWPQGCYSWPHTSLHLGVWKGKSSPVRAEVVAAAATNSSSTGSRRSISRSSDNHIVLNTCINVSCWSAATSGRLHNIEWPQVCCSWSLYSITLGALVKCGCNRAVTEVLLPVLRCSAASCLAWLHSSEQAPYRRARPGISSWSQ